MATITTDTNLDDLSRTAGEVITVQAGATLTIDTPPAYGVGILGALNVEDGRVLVDATRFKHWSVASPSGSEPAFGTVLTGGTSGATAKFAKVLASGEVAATILSGTFQGGETVSGGGYAFTLDAETPGFFRLPIAASPSTGSGLATYEFRGDWFTVGIGNGADTQTFTLPHAGYQNAVVINGALWHRILDSDAFANYNPNAETGQVFKHTPGTATLTFGTSVDGGVPPNGAEVRIPSLHISTADGVSPPATELVGSNDSAYASFNDDSAAIFQFERCNFSSFRSYYKGQFSVDATDCVFSTRTYFSQMGDRPLLSRCAFFGIGFATNSDHALEFRDCPNGYIVEDSTICTHGTKTHAIQGARDITIRSSKIINTAANTYRTEFSLSENILIEDCLLIFMAYGVSTTNTARFLNNKMAGGIRTRHPTNVFLFGYTARDILLDGLTLAAGGLPWRSYLFEGYNCSDVRVQNVGSPAAPIDLTTNTRSICNLYGLYGKHEFYRVYCSNNPYFFFTIIQPSGAGPVAVWDCAYGYATYLALRGNNIQYRACQGNTLDLSGGRFLVGACTHDVFLSDTTGRIYCVFVPGSEVQNPFSVTAGSPQFDGLGRCYMSSGDQMEILFYEIRGHSSFENNSPIFTGSSTSNLSLEYSLDLGSGFGAWTAATGANLSAEPVSAAGFRLKLRLSAAGDCRIDAIQLRTLTTLADQTAAPHATDLVSVTIDSDLDLTGAEIRIYDLNNLPAGSLGTEIAGTENSSLPSFAFATTAHNEIWVQVLQAGYEEFGQRFVVPATDSTITANLTLESNA